MTCWKPPVHGRRGRNSGQKGDAGCQSSRASARAAARLTSADLWGGRAFPVVSLLII
jgi:hypothetical protein